MSKRMRHWAPRCARLSGTRYTRRTTKRSHPLSRSVTGDTTDDGRPADEDQVVLHCTFWVPGPGTCDWTGKASEAGWCTHYQEWICPSCGSSDGLHIIQDTTALEPAPDAHLEEAYELRFEVA